MRAHGKGCFAILIAAFSIFILVGCQRSEERPPQAQAAPKVYTDELHERHTWLKLLWTEQYAELDKTIAAAYAQRDKGEISSNRLRGRFWQLQHADPAFDPRFNAWVEQQKSSHAYLARGLNRFQRADGVRGQAPARQIPEEVIAKVAEVAQSGVDDMDTALKLDPRCAMCIGGKIWAGYFFRIQDRDPRLIDQALALDPTLWQPVGAHFGLLYPQWGGSESEMQAFIQRMEAKPETAKLVPHLKSLFYFRRGMGFQENGDAGAAIKEYETAISCYPDSDALKNVAELYMRQGQAAKAAKALEMNLDNDPWDLYTLEALAQAYIGSGDKAKGIAMLEKRDELIARFRAGE